jgi:F420-non-reducing hydrogenase small subunit
LLDKLKFGFYWAASCGGCEIAVLDTNEKLLDIVERAEIVLWPVAMDTKYADVRQMPDRYMDVCFFNGSVRNSEQLEMAELLRAKSKVLVAFGSCAHHGCIPGLANLHRGADILETVYQKEPSVVNPDKTMPSPRSQVPEGELTIPTFFDQVRPLNKVVPVDYYLPGCPPAVPRILDAVNAIFANDLPPKDSVLGPNKALCDECDRNKHVAKKMEDIKRSYEVQADPGVCFLEQGIICMGPATRGGCGQRCINGNWPCTGCMGPTPDVTDQGGKMIAALTSILKTDTEKDMTKAETDGMMAKVKDPVGTFYMYGLADASVGLRRRK